MEPVYMDGQRVVPLEWVKRLLEESYGDTDYVLWALDNSSPVEDDDDE